MRSALLRRLLWKLRRLSSMGPPEVSHRVAESLRKRQWRSDKRGWAAFSVPGTGLVVPNALRAKLRAPLSAEIRSGILATHAMATSRKFEFLGQAWPVQADGKIPWLVDPKTGRNWPGAERYCFDVDHRHEADLGDVKLVWELNRLQFLPALTLLAGERPDAGEPSPWLVLDDWMKANPPFRGVNWNSGIELALRIVSVALAVAAWPRELTGDEDASVRSFLGAHAFWIARYASRYSSANNHLIAEGLGLFITGLLMPDAPQAGMWKAQGREIIVQESERQFYEDGVGVEQSPTYTAFSAEMIALACMLAEEYGEPLPAAVPRRLERVATWLRTIMDGSGQVPRIGDDDEGRVIGAPPDREPLYVASIVAAISGLVGDPLLMPPIHQPSLRDLLFAPAKASGSAPDGTATFQIGGYSVVRETIGSRHLLMVFDHGPLGYLAIAAHGHADTLAIWLHLDDQPVIIDAGTYLYHAAGAWRGAFCGTRTHNTLRLDCDSSTQTGPFMWSNKAAGRLDDQRPGPNWGFRASHDGYVRSHDLVHERAVERTQSSIIIRDRLVGASREQNVTLSLLFHPSLTVISDGGGISIRRAGQEIVFVQPPERFSTAIVCGDEQSMRGWASPRFGERVPAPQLLMTGRLAGDGEAMTELKLRT